jgi:hypothetical protein
MRAAATIFTLILATSASGGIEHTILHGVSVGSVRAWSGPDTVPGLTRETLQAVAESHLRASGIPIDAAAPTVLSISATVVVGEGMCFVTLDATLVEEARLQRNGFLVQASSWRGRGLVAARDADCAKDVADAEEEALADFVEHFRAMNPTPATRR